VVVASILLVMVAAGLLLAGLLQGSDTFYFGSIVASVVAALALLVGVRQLADGKSLVDDIDGAEDWDGASGGLSQVGPEFVPGQPAGVRADDDPSREPPDEPSAEHVSTAQVGQVAALATEVVVVDGRPRYHLPACQSLLGRAHERISVTEAAELGFTPCGQCCPVAALLSAAAAG
jgi:hypothetical protein